MIEKPDATFLHHDLITPHILKHNQDKSKTLKLIGSVVIPKKYVVKIQLDRRFQRLYDAETEPKIKAAAAEESK